MSENNRDEIEKKQNSGRRRPLKLVNIIMGITFLLGAIAYGVSMFSNDASIFKEIFLVVGMILYVFAAGVGVGNYIGTRDKDK
jgi:hypothetical protein